MPFERRLNDPALHAAPAAVNQAHLGQPRLAGRPHVFIDDGGNVARREGMQIERAFDWDAMDHGFW